MENLLKKKIKIEFTVEGLLIAMTFVLTSAYIGWLVASHL